MESLQIYYFFPKPRTFSYFFVMPGIAVVPGHPVMPGPAVVPGHSVMPGHDRASLLVLPVAGAAPTPEGKMPVKLTLPGTSPSGFSSPALAWATGGRKVGHCTEPAVAPDR